MCIRDRWDTTAATGTSTLPLQQGQDYTLNVTVTNPGTAAIKNVALSTLLPSGMEIGTASTDKPAGITYQDVRDDRVLSYFDLAAGETKTVSVKLNAAFLGEFYFPAISGEAMYQPAVRARTAGSVSYTHLDVYKRQLNPLNLRLKLPQWNWIFKFRD